VRGSHLNFEVQKPIKKPTEYDKIVKFIVKSIGYENKNIINFKSLELGKRTNSCIRVNTRELDKELFTK